MRNIMKLTLTALAAAAMLAVAVGGASARNLSVTNRNFRSTFAPLTFAEPFGFINVRCNITMEGTFHESTIAKVVGRLIGYVTRAFVKRPCTGGEAWVHNGIEAPLGVVAETHLPWHITYEGFNGTLPNITGVRLLLVRPLFTLSVPGICLSEYTAENVNGIANVGAGGTITGLQSVGTETFPPRSGNCPAGRFVGTGSVFLLGTTNAISIRLI